MPLLPRLAACCSLLVVACAAPAQDYPLGTLTVHQPWSQALPPTTPSVAAYFGVTNSGTENDVLLGVDSPIAGQAQVHEHVSHDGMMKMQAVASVVIPAAGAATFAPMGNHVMMLDLGDRSQLQAGGHFPLTLHFQRAGDITVDVNVLSDAPAPDHTHGN